MAAAAEAVAVLNDTANATVIPLAQLCIAPWNARKTYNNDSIAEMAASVESNGIINPLLVRPIDRDGDPVPADQTDLFEIVGGHRRYKGAARAGKTAVPCIVREMSNEQAREIGMLDNLQREDLQPLEEAKGLEQLMDAHGATIDSVAAKVGKSASYVARRLQILDAIVPVQEALAAGAIEVGHALELARLEGQQQTKLLAWLNVGAVAEAEQDSDLCPHGIEYDEDCEQCESGDFGDDEDEDVIESADRKEEAPKQISWTPTAKTVAALRQEIGRTMLRVLGDAPFALDDEIDPGPCTTCAKRSSNSSLLFPDASQDLCTDAECYQGKLRAWVRFSLDAADRKGKTLKLIGSNSYYYGDNKPAGIIPRYDFRLVDSAKPEQVCEFAQEAIWYDGPQMGHVAQICIQEGCPTHHPRTTGGKVQTAEDIAKEEEKRKKNRKKILAQVKIARRYRGALIDALGTAPVPDSVLSDFVTEVAAKVIRGLYGPYEKRFSAAIGWDEKVLGFSGRDLLRKHLDSLRPVERLRVAMLAMHYGDMQVSEQNPTHKPSDFERIAKAIGVDHTAIWEAAQIDPKEKAKAEKAAAKAAKQTPATPEPKADADPKTTATKDAKKKPSAKPKAKAKPAAKKAAKGKK